MKKTFTLGIILASSLLLSACDVKNNNSSDSSDKVDSGTSFSLRELIAQNIPQKCTYSSSDENGSFIGEVIISGNKFRQNITTKSDQGEKTLHYISDGEYIYTWEGDGSSFAAKFPADFSDTNIETENNSQEFEYSQADLDGEYQGQCSPTTASDSDFQVPKNIKFEDYSKFLDDLKSNIPEINTKDLE